jgi:hypothetical protein
MSTVCLILSDSRNAKSPTLATRAWGTLKFKSGSPGHPPEARGSRRLRQLQNYLHAGHCSANVSFWEPWLNNQFVTVTVSLFDLTTIFLPALKSAGLAAAVCEI